MKLSIMKVDEYLYYLEDEMHNQYTLNLEFLDIDTVLKSGNFIYMNEKLLDKNYEGYSTNYTFGNFENQYGKANISLEDVDVIKVEIEDKEIYLKRLYG